MSDLACFFFQRNRGPAFPALPAACVPCPGRPRHHRSRPRHSVRGQISTRMLGRRTAPFPPFIIPYRVPHGLTQDPSTDRASAQQAALSTAGRWFGWRARVGLPWTSRRASHKACARLSRRSKPFGRHTVAVEEIIHTVRGHAQPACASSGACARQWCQWCVRQTAPRASAPPFRN